MDNYESDSDDEFIDYNVVRKFSHFYCMPLRVCWDCEDYLNPYVYDFHEKYSKIYIYQACKSMFTCM